MGNIEIVGRIVSGAAGLILIGLGAGLTWWAMAADKSISSVGIGGIFVVGVLLTLAGLLGRAPSSLAFGKDGVTLQLVADAVKDVKENVALSATKVAADAAVMDAVVEAKTEGDAEKVTAAITQRIVDAMPATADLTRRALDSLR
ncbi:MAG TPA: hypothetical protein VFR67_22665 [Pilimelia sp.]|nr:hypothetical protein [Pilimelia sp.]